MSRPKLLIVVNDVPFFLSHRLPVGVAARQAGYDVAVAAPLHPRAAEIEASGIAFYEIPMPRNRGSLLGEVRAAARLWQVLSRYRPDVAHLVTAKPIIFGGILCRLRGIPVLAAVSGLGHIFVSDDLKSKLAATALLAGYGAALRRRRALAIFQNADNLEVFRKAGIVDHRFIMIRGSGADLAAFDPAPPANEMPLVLMPSRMLWTKGVAEFVEAARLLRLRGCTARFVLAGNNDPGNPANIEESQLRAWADEGAVEWIGYQPDVAALLKRADLVVLPSYLEGLPKTIVDAAAAGRPCVTTDVPGCRDAIVDGETGLLCKVRDVADLADKTEELLRHPRRMLEMGRKARDFAEREYDIHSVIRAHLECYDTLISDRPHD